MYWQVSNTKVERYTATGTMYVYNGNPNRVNYGYTNTSDLNSAVQLVDTYKVVVKSNKVLDAVVERLSGDYPNITPGYIASTISMGSVSETGVLAVRCTTDQPQKSADICNAVMDVAPAEIIRVVSAGSIEIIDYAAVPKSPDGYSPRDKYLIGALAGAAVAAALLALAFLLDQRVRDTKELNERYTLPILASLRRIKQKSQDPVKFRLDDDSPMDKIESYAKLRMNLLYAMAGKEKHSIIVTSAISGEGKSTIAANLAISMALSGKRVLLVDADLRRGCQRQIFHDTYFKKSNKRTVGLSEVLVGIASWENAVLNTHMETLQLMPSGRFPPNPTELLDSAAMRELLPIMEKEYDMVVIDVPPINIVADALALASQVAGSLFVVRQGFSDHREIRKALNQAEMSGLDLLGFVFYGEKVAHRGYYYNRYYHSYYRNYDSRKNRSSHKSDRELKEKES